MEMGYAEIFNQARQERQRRKDGYPPLSGLDPSLTQQLPIDEHSYTQLQESSQLRKIRAPRESGPPLLQIKKLPIQLRMIISGEGKKSDNRVYDPMMVSLGPYHHGKPELSAAQEFKHVFLDELTLGQDDTRNVLYKKILEIIDKIRSCYADTICVDKYDDEALAEMMLLDGSFIFAFIERVAGAFHKPFWEWENQFGVATLRFAIRDMMVLENQIPLEVLKLLLQSKHSGQVGEQRLCKFLNWILFGEPKCSNCTVHVNGDRELPPLHLLEACRRMLGGKPGSPKPQTNLHLINSYKEIKRINDDQYLRTAWKTPKLEDGLYDQPSPDGTKRFQSSSITSSITSSSRSVTDLKAKGILFRRSPSYVYRDVKFKSGSFYGELQLPSQTVSSNTRVILSNMIAYEVTSGSITEYEVLSHVNFMKSLIQSPDDVKELQGKGILFNRFHNNEQVVQEFRAIETFGIDNIDIYRDVKWEIEDHCRSKAKTWFADLMHTRFKSPWTAIALLAAVFLLCLTFLQTYFTIHPRS